MFKNYILNKCLSFVQIRIVEGLKGLLKIPPEGDIKSMKGYTNLYRLRIEPLGFYLAFSCLAINFNADLW